MVSSSVLVSESFASDLIYKSGFESNALVSGHLNGMKTGNIQLKLSSADSDEMLTIEQNGGFLFESYVTVGTSWQVTIEQLPAKQQCSLSHSSGTMTQIGVDNLMVECGDSDSEWDVMNWDEGVWQ